MTIINPRKKKLDAISAKIAAFIMVDTFTDEPDAQRHLTKAVEELDAAVEILVANDEKEKAKGETLTVLPKDDPL